MEERRVVDPEARADDRVVLVAGGADRVEAAVRLLQLASGDVELARRQLVLEQGEARSRGQPTSATQRRIGVEPVRGRLRRVEIRVELSLDDGDAIPGHAMAGDSVGFAGGPPFYRRHPGLPAGGGSHLHP